MGGRNKKMNEEELGGERLFSEKTNKVLFWHICLPVPPYNLSFIHFRGENVRYKSILILKVDYFTLHCNQCKSCKCAVNVENMECESNYKWQFI